MRTLFDGQIHVHYGQFYVETADFASLPGLPDSTFEGQRNGLCGAAQAGILFLVTGLHTGLVGIRVEHHDAEPGVGDEWEDVVEASFTPLSGNVTLVEWAGEASYPLALSARSYRVRYCATGMDEGSKGLPRVDGEPVTDWYLLQFWPAEPSRDAVVRQSSAAAHYFHSTWGGECPGRQQGR